MRAVPFGKDSPGLFPALLTEAEEMKPAAFAVAGYRQLPLLLPCAPCAGMLGLVTFVC